MVPSFLILIFGTMVFLYGILRPEIGILPIGMLGQNDKSIAATTIVFLEQANRTVVNNLVHGLPYHTTGKMIFGDSNLFGNTKKALIGLFSLLQSSEIRSEMIFKYEVWKNIDFVFANVWDKNGKRHQFHLSNIGNFIRPISVRSVLLMHLISCLLAML